MKSKSTSSFQRNFIFNACMNQSGIINKNQKVDPHFNLKNKNKIHSSKTLGKPVSIHDLHLNKKVKSIKKPQLCSPFQQILKPQDKQDILINPSLTNSAHLIQNPTFRHCDLVQSQHNRRSRYQGNKIKIFSNDNSKGSIKFNEERGKSVSRDSYGTSNSRQKRGIQVTKTLLKKISGMYSSEDFSRNSQPTVSNRSSLYQKNQKKQEQDSFYNQTGFMMTTWDSQRTTEEYQLSKDYDSINNQTRNDNFGLANYGTVNMLNNSYESNQVLKDYSKQNFNYTNNEIADYSMRPQRQIFSNNRISQPMLKVSKNFPSSNSINKTQNATLIKQKVAPLPLEYQQRQSYHLTIKPNDTGKKQLGSSISKGKLFTKTSQSKIFSSNNINANPQKNSLVFSKSKQFQKMTTNIQRKHPLFQTAHQILSEQVSSINQPFHVIPSQKAVSGEELTNMLYGNRDSIGRREQKMEEKDKEKYLVRYKNKTLEDMSVKQSMVEGYDNYYQ